jgi:hypothetical protein
MKVALVVTTDGRREYLVRSIGSLHEQLRPWLPVRGIVDDSGDPDYQRFLHESFPDFQMIHHMRRQGFQATFRDAWELALSLDAEYVLHVEDDFTYNEPIDLERMADLLDANPQLAQIALKRQPVNDQERAVGGLMEMRPGAWTQQDGFVEHAVTFTSNPSLIPRRVIELVLADPAPKTEPNITACLLTHNLRFGYLGRIEDPPLVEHIGEERMAGWLQ